MIAALTKLRVFTLALDSYTLDHSVLFSTITQLPRLASVTLFSTCMGCLHLCFTGQPSWLARMISQGQNSLASAATWFSVAVNLLLKGFAMYEHVIKEYLNCQAMLDKLDPLFVKQAAKFELGHSKFDRTVARWDGAWQMYTSLSLTTAPRNSQTTTNTLSLMLSSFIVQAKWTHQLCCLSAWGGGLPSSPLLGNNFTCGKS